MFDATCCCRVREARLGTPTITTNTGITSADIALAVVLVVAVLLGPIQQLREGKAGALCAVVPVVVDVQHAFSSLSQRPVCVCVGVGGVFTNRSISIAAGM